MIILSIEKSKKHLTAVQFPDETVLLDNDTVAVFGLQEGDHISDDRLQELTDDSARRRAKEKALWLLSFRDYPQKELKDRLRRDFGADIAAQTAETLADAGIISDRRYAENAAEQMITFKGYSKNRARQELYLKGIDRELIAEILDNIETDETAAIAALIQKKYADDLDDEKGRRRVFAAMARRGYGFDDIKAAIRQLTMDD